MSLAVEIANMTTEELEHQLVEVGGNLARVKTQLDYAKSEAAETGNYSDRDWFNRAKHAKRMLGREHQLIQAELGKRKKRESRSFNNTIERRFIDAARRRLDPVLFSELMDEANEELQE